MERTRRLLGSADPVTAADAGRAVIRHRRAALAGRALLLGGRRLGGRSAERESEPERGDDQEPLGGASIESPAPMMHLFDLQGRMWWGTQFGAGEALATPELRRRS